MQSTPKHKKSLKIFSIVQLVLGIMGLIALFSVPFGTYELKSVYYYDYDTGITHYTYPIYSFLVGESSYTSAAATGIALMYLLFIGFSLFRILSPNIFGSSTLNRILTKCAKFAPLLGFGIIGFGLVALSGWEQFYSRINDLNYAWLDTGSALILVGGIIVIATGLVANRLSRPASPIGYGYAGYIAPQPGPSYQQPQVPVQPSYSCPSCGGPLTFVPEYNRWYCYNCKKYA
jgi:hypothetical protein